MLVYKLTEEGRKYLEKGLPERNLVELLKRRKKIGIEDAKNKIENLSIALQWAKKNKWIMVTQGEIELIKEPDKEAEELKALKMVEREGEIGEWIASILLKRKLIKEEKEDIFKRAEKQIKGKKEITALTPELIRTGLWKKVVLKAYKVDVIGKKVNIGKRHPYVSFLNSVRKKLVELGFKEMIGPMIETEFWNFDALYQPQNHPARDWASTYKLRYPKMGTLPKKRIVENVKACHEDGWETGSSGWRYNWNKRKAAMLVPRAHDTSISARYLANGVEIPGKYFSIVRCFRPDVIDATHGVEFYQMGGFVVAPNLNFRHILGLLKLFAQEIAGIKETRFYSDYYPFTEPSVQISGKHPKIGWIELAGAGIFREELTKPLGIDEPVIAWGFGIDRLAIHKLDINDIRFLFTQNLEWLRKQPVIR